jgi:hypothetical protein
MIFSVKNISFYGSLCSITYLLSDLCVPPLVEVTGSFISILIQPLWSRVKCFGAWSTISYLNIFRTFIYEILKMRSREFHFHYHGNFIFIIVVGKILRKSQRQFRKSLFIIQIFSGISGIPLLTVKYSFDAKFLYSIIFVCLSGPKTHGKS